ncbi:Gram-negative bacterial tonB protein [Pseudomonas saudimassiliensis]|uniref:Gram-negative bacterial tonB protein n=1 Tax=Pseudomonas saudimassiliensis TaxID=1461581 RepID=A0A078MG81_9PSED|nr:energy transducer TonB [Pseudomonas saudimassiliensis]CEA05305.1 Gram-negative bacterial tonB protein [Pseudomonas saudimassiliensis]CEF27069.1 Gram-negative bacterial tonB protein [Pseudomonas saudimassiliensis]
MHTFGANQEWAAPAPTTAPDPTAVRGRPVPSAYADTVKNRVTAQLKRPEGSVYKPPPGYKGDPNDFKRQCYIPYEITVDANGRVLSYEIDRCGDELLDAAAERAVRGAGPFPPPPNQGAEKYVIYGTAIFIN